MIRGHDEPNVWQVWALYAKKCVGLVYVSGAWPSACADPHPSVCSWLGQECLDILTTRAVIPTIAQARGKSDVCWDLLLGEDACYWIYTHSSICTRHTLNAAAFFTVGNPTEAMTCFYVEAWPLIEHKDPSTEYSGNWQQSKLIQCSMLFLLDVIGNVTFFCEW